MAPREEFEPPKDVMAEAYVQPWTLPRWVTIPLGLVLVPFTLLCVIGSSLLLVAPNVPPSFLTISIGGIFLAGSVWVFCLSLKLLFLNPKRPEGLVSPLGLRVIAGIFAIIPVAALLTGSFWDKPLIHSIMAVAYVGIVAGLLNLARSRSQKPDDSSVMFEREVVVRLTEDGISASYPTGTVQTILWRDVESIAIETNDSGPWGADVWWLIDGESTRCAYPQGATGEDEALVELQKRFTGFDDAKVIEAMGCTSNARFVCWKKLKETESLKDK